MAAADVSMILRDFWKMWLKGFDAEIDCQQIAQSLFEWTQLFVENQAPLARPTKQQEYFPYQGKTLNTWFKERHSDERKIAINMINVNGHGLESKCYTTDDNKFPNTPAEGDNYEIFYHGTTAAHVKSILDGIDLSVGGKMKDFSDGDGFYVTNKFDNVWPNAIWANRRPRCSTVLIFKVDKSELRKFAALDLWSNWDAQVQEKWRKVVSTFRNGESSEAFKNVDFIEGPLCAGTKTCIRANSCFPDRESHQLCVRSERCAELFDKSLLSVLFFKRNL